MKKNEMKKIYYGAGLLLAGLAAGTAAVAAVLIHKKNNEKVFREAELRAMEEMDDLNAEDEQLYGEVPLEGQEDTSDIDVDPVAEDLLQDLADEEISQQEKEEEDLPEEPENKTEE